MAGVPRRASGIGMLLAGVIVIAAGFGVALVETLRLPNYAIGVVVGGSVVAVGLIRRLSR